MLYNKAYSTLMENYRSIKTVTRLFYPRNFNLSAEFIQAFQKEYRRLKTLNIDDKRIIQRITKALPFHKASDTDDTN
jgi:hypothetical protein